MEWKNIIGGVCLVIFGAMMGRSSPINNQSHAKNNVNIIQENPGKNRNLPEISGKNRNFQDFTVKFVDINNSDLATIKSLPGIGDKKAKEIIDRRNKVKFTSIYQLLEEGILGVESFERNKDLIIAGD